VNAAAVPGVIILAAGAARRYGASKLELPLEGVATVRRAALAALAVSDRVVIVTGAWHARLVPLLRGLDLTIVHNEQWQRGKGSSIACGVRALQDRAPHCGAAVIMLADQVLIGATELQRLVDACSGPPHDIAAASYGGALGAPCCFARSYFAQLAQLDGEDGAQLLLQRHAGHVCAVAMPEAQFDIDTPADYAAALERLG
jgi:molybdenum cofactor cytidylyltransferase